MLARAKKPAPQRPKGVFTQSIAPEEKKKAADYVADENRGGDVPKSGVRHFRQLAADLDLRDGDGGAEPNKSVLEDGRTFRIAHVHTPYVGITQVRFEGSGPLGPLSARTRELP